jgi:hypothetical protein
LINELMSNLPNEWQNTPDKELLRQFTMLQQCVVRLTAVRNKMLKVRLPIASEIASMTSIRDRLQTIVDNAKE